MKTFLIVTALAISTSFASAQSWHTSYPQAVKQAKAEGKRLLIDFTGSDWCGWCIKLDREVFSTPEFKRYAEKNLVLLKVDFPRRGGGSEQRAANEGLAKRYGVKGFPTLIVQSPEGQPIQRLGYVPGGPNAFLRHLGKPALR